MNYVKLLKRVSSPFRKLFGRDAIDRRNRTRLKNKEVSIIASNCNGGIISHDLGLQFRSPFVNLWIKPNDYIKLLTNLETYLEKELVFVQEDGISYPVALLDDIRINFQHYLTEDDAKEKWIERKSRMNYNNVALFFSDRDGCSYEDLLNFDKLPYSRKVVFTHVKRPEIKSSFYIKGFEHQSEVGVLSEYKNKILEIRYLDDFDYVSFLNKGL